MVQKQYYFSELPFSSFPGKSVFGVGIMGVLLGFKLGPVTEASVDELYGLQKWSWRCLCD